MSSITFATSLRSIQSERPPDSEALNSSSAFRRDLFTDGFINTRIAIVLVNVLNAEDICALTRISKACFVFCNNYKPQLKELQYKDRLFTQLLPGIKEEQLPSNLVVKENGIAWEKTYKAISCKVFGPAFYKSIGIRTGPSCPIPQGLLEKKNFPSFSVEIVADSKLGFTQDNRLTAGPKNPADPADPDNYVLKFAEYFRVEINAAAEKCKTVLLPNTQTNRDFFEANPIFKVTFFPKKSPLEQGSTFIYFPKILEVDVPAESPLSATHEGLLTEEPSLNQLWNQLVGGGKRTIRFLNTLRNWQILSTPVLNNPSKEAGIDNPYIAKYLNANAKPVKFSYLKALNKAFLDIPPQSEWKAPIADLFPVGNDYTGLARKLPKLKDELLQLERSPMTIQQDSLHRIFIQIRGDLDPYAAPLILSLTSTNTVFRDAIFQLGTYVTSSPMDSDEEDDVVDCVKVAKVNFYCYPEEYPSPRIGWATAWISASSVSSSDEQLPSRVSRGLELFKKLLGNWLMS